MQSKSEKQEVQKINKHLKTNFCTGSILLISFLAWTILIQTIDVQPIGVNASTVGFATFNSWFHNLTGVHMAIYMITDWLGLVSVFVCMVFAEMGFRQLIKRKSLFKVDYDIIVLGIYYMVVIMGYLIFEEIPINYRPIFIEGRMEASYPSSTTLLVLSVMPTLVEQTNRRVKSQCMRKIIQIATTIFSVFMVIGRLISGVHWFTDIVGGILLSVGLFYIYKAVILWKYKEHK